MKVVCDSTVLIGLAKIGKIEILKNVFRTIYIPQAVYEEIVTKGKNKPGSGEIAGAKWINCQSVNDRRMVKILQAQFGYGESEVLLLGKQLNADWLLLDDEKARNAAISANFKVMGLGGVLSVAKELGFIHHVKPLLDELKNKNFRMSDKIYNEILKKSGEK